MRAPKPSREVVARALCRHDGHPENVKFEGKSMWESYLPAADAALAALGWRDNDEPTSLRIIGEPKKPL